MHAGILIRSMCLTFELMFALFSAANAQWRLDGDVRQESHGFANDVPKLVQRAKCRLCRA